MCVMSDFDWLDLDARLLRILVAVVETGSVTAAADALGVTQSAVSHMVQKLRGIAGDELFVRAGRGIQPTPHALLLAERARGLLRDLERFPAPEAFEPSRWRGTVTIAANDFQREALLPALALRLHGAAPGVCLHIIPSNVPTADMLREGGADLIVSPRPPETADLMQKKLFDDRYRVFFDAAVREPPLTTAAYLDALHATVVYEPRRMLDIDTRLAERGLRRRFAVTVPGFSALPSFVAGTDLIVTAPGLLRLSLFRALASVPPPVPCPTMPMFMIWSRHRQADPAHRWIRGEIEAAARAVAARVG